MRWLAVGLGLLASLAPAAARASDDKRACLSTYEAAQRARHKGALVAAAKDLAQCVRPACPEVLRRDCASWQIEVERATPSVVFAARAEGSDVRAVRVFVDDVLVAERIDDDAYPLDPGRHVVRFELGALLASSEVTLAEGQKRQRVEVGFESLVLTPAPKTAGPAEPRAPPPPPPIAPPARPILPFVLGAAGLAAIGAGAFFEVQAFGRKRDLDACRPMCTQDQVDATHRSFFTGDLFLALGGASIGAGVLTYLLLPRSSPAMKVEPTPTGARLRFEAVF
jgi:hypothetical protein